MYQSQFFEMFNKVTETKSLCEICRPKQWPTIPTKDFTEDGYLVYGANGIIGHYSEYNHESPTILMACRGASCGAINISKPYSYITGNAMCMDEIIPEVSFEYLSYFLSNYNYKTIITGGAQPQITYTNLKKVLVPIPPYEKQLKFALIYQQADKSKFSGLKSQFIEMFGTLDNHPAEYAVKTLRDLSECYAGATPSTKVKEYWDNGHIPWMSSGEVHMEHVTETESKITESGYQQTSTKMVPVHSVVIALAGQGKTRGKVAITEIPLCTNQSLCAIVPSKDIHYEYLYHNLKGRYLELRGMAGDVNGRGGLNLKIVQSIQVIVPPIDEQMKFVAIAQQADKSKQIAFSRAS